MSDIHLPDPKAWTGAVRLTHLGVILADGPDTATFLHGQLSQDVTGQSTQEARLAAFCSAKGRMQASFLNLRPATDTFWLLTDLSLVPQVVKRLSMFVLRSKTKLSDAGDQLVAVGLIGADIPVLAGGAVPESWQSLPLKDGLLTRLPDVLGAQRFVWVGPHNAADEILASSPSIALENWAWLEVLSGIPRIQSETVDQFVPQMINFELIGGVNFKKGCYPGQEVVARSQYRGTTKRRAFVVHSNAPVHAGQEIFANEDNSQPAGMVINAAAIPELPNSYSALVELKLAEQQSKLHLSESPAFLSLGHLPYDLPSAE